jgi:hypothetical protein
MIFNDTSIRINYKEWGDNLQEIAIKLVNHGDNKQQRMAANKMKCSIV